MCYYFLKDPGTTNIYPDGHTLSLHDSLPIYPQIAEVAIVGVPDARTGERAIAVIVPKSNASAPDVASLAGFLIGTGIAKYKIPEQRSEEHTSELQSLMRISYAVFCLKKKKTTKSSNQDM